MHLRYTPVDSLLGCYANRELNTNNVSSVLSRSGELTNLLSVRSPLRSGPDRTVENEGSSHPYIVIIITCF